MPNPDLSFNYERGLPSESEDLYYHTTIPEKEHMFPIDPLMLSPTGRTTSNAASTHQITLGMEAGVWSLGCKRVFLMLYNWFLMDEEVPTSKRSRADVIIKDIDSIRNGLFMNKLLHVTLGHTFALLKTPNFAMNTSDIDPITPDGDKLRLNRNHCVPIYKVLHLFWVAGTERYMGSSAWKTSRAIHPPLMPVPYPRGFPSGLPWI
ncbi:hypothetical protein C8Q74DRAFT_1217008 [Fomes fomentarius]|nr:hypothetical protein C8Q74DRAFT_1217008 [Fomes fomentarius]